MNLMPFVNIIILLADGGGGDVIVTLVVLSFIGFFIWLVVRYFMREAKKEIVKNHLQKFSRTDPFWDERKMKQTVQLVHNNAHIAWARRSSYYITGLASEDLVKEWENIWNSIQQKGQAFHSTRPEIDSITIVGAEDSSDNNKDNFTAEISAYVIRYVYEKATRQPIDGHYNGKNLVHDHFTFTRKDDKWILTEVKFYTGLHDSMLVRTEQEKPGKPEDV